MNYNSSHPILYKAISLAKKRNLKKKKMYQKKPYYHLIPILKVVI